MLENVNLSRKLPREEYDALLPRLQRRLYDLEKACWDHHVPSVVLFEGWEAAGKGGAIAALTQRLDPRGFKVHTVTPPRTHEAQFPWLRRFWLRVPNHGEMAIFDHSWYRRVLDDRVAKAVSKKEWRQAYRDIAEMERMLADDGTAFVKLFFHVTKKEQAKRFRRIEADPFEAWRVTEEDWRLHRRYAAYRDAVEEMLEQTESEFAPWTIVEATSRWWSRKKVFDTVIHALEKRLGDLVPPQHDADEVSRRDAELRAATRRLAGGEEQDG